VYQAFTPFLGDPNRIKILNCDEEVCVGRWVNLKSTVLYPFVSTGTNFTERFSKRADDLSTPSFQQALRLAEMYSDKSNDGREDALKLLQMGSLARQKLAEQCQVFAEFSIGKVAAEFSTGKGAKKKIARMTPS